jgi:putative transposase
VSKQRLTATDRVREEIDGLFADRDRELGEVLEEVARLSVRLVMQSALEAEVTEFLGRDRYARGERARAGSRNGYGDTTIKTTAGAVELRRPKVRGTLEKFSSRLLGKHVTRTNALESLVISGWVRGLSDRDIEAALREALGPQATVSKSTVSRICEQIKDEFDTWRTRDLTGVAIDYLFVDASHFKMHDGARSEPVLVAYGITTEGNSILLHLDGVSAESTDACVGFLEDMVARGLGSPVLTATDGAQVCVPRSTRSSLEPAANVASSTAPATALPRCPRSTKTPCAATSGRSSTSMRPSPPATKPSAKHAAAPASSKRPGPRPTPERSRPSSTASTSSSPTFTTPARTGPVSGTPTSSSGPSARPDAGSRSSAASPANAPHSRCCSPYSTAPPAAGAVSPTPPPTSGCCR